MFVNFTGKEFIICSAILYDDGKKYVHQPKNIQTGYVICGYRHCSIYESVYILREYSALALHIMKQDKLIKKEDCKKLERIRIEGFLSDKNNFYDRKEAAKIAIQSGQVLEGEIIGGNLMSENLYTSVKE